MWPISRAVVEDDVDRREILSILLNSGGYLVVPATSVAEAMKVMDAGADPDVVITDICMPDDGTELRQSG